MMFPLKTHDFMLVCRMGARMSNIENILSKAFDSIKVCHDEHIAGDGLVVEYRNPQKLMDLLQLEINPDGVSYEELFGEIGEYLRFCVHTGN